MSIRIKSEEIHRLARELAVLTGEGMTHAITVALGQRLEGRETLAVHVNRSGIARRPGCEGG